MAPHVDQLEQSPTPLSIPGQREFAGNKIDKSLCFMGGGELTFKEKCGTMKVALTSLLLGRFQHNEGMRWI